MKTAQPMPWKSRPLLAPLLMLLTVTCAEKTREKRDVHATPTNAAARVAPPAPQAETSAVPSAAPAPFRAEEDVSIRLQREIDAAAQEDPAGAARMATVRPILTCVEKAPGGAWRAHFGYKNKGSNELPIATGLHNRLWPPPITNGQPTVFAPGAHEGAVKLTFNEAGSVAWVLGQSFEVATKSSTPCGTRGTRGRRPHKTVH